MTNLRPTLDQTLAAAELLKAHLTPVSLREHADLGLLMGCRVFIKHEYDTPTNSFKVRGALTLVNMLKEKGSVKRVVTASTGNHGAAMAYACQKYNLPITVVIPQGTDESKIYFIRKFGADLEYLGCDLDKAKEMITERGLPDEHLFIEDGSVPEIVAGTSTIGLEITKVLPDVDTVVVPVGNGSLIGGIGSAIKEHNSSIQVVGVQARKAPCMTLSFRAGKPINTESCDTFATGMAVRVSIPEAVRLMLEVVDDVILVSEEEMKEAIGIFYKSTDVILEGAGAAPIAGSLKMKERLRDKKVCLIATGTNLDEGMKKEILEKYV